MAVILRTSLSLWAGVGCSFEPGVRAWGWYWSVGAEDRSREGCLSLDVSSSWDWSVSEWVVAMGRKGGWKRGRTSSSRSESAVLFAGSSGCWCWCWCWNELEAGLLKYPAVSLHLSFAFESESDATPPS